MATLILVKHAPPEVRPEVASPRWVLSAEGRARCGWLAAELAAQGVTRLYSSLEPKALETAALVGLDLGLEVRPRRDLNENDRTGLAFGTADELKQTIRRFFEAPSALVMGEETADAALARFETALRAVIVEAPDETVAVVAHGTVLTLLVARYNDVDAFEFWEALTLPACVVLDAANFRIEGAVRTYPAGAPPGS